MIIVLSVPLPNPLFDKPHATVLRSSDSTLLDISIADDEQWRFPASRKIPDKFKTCILYFEDEYFYYHPGINPISFWRAMLQNIKAGKIISGGSTLSMQTVRMAFGNQKRTYIQKIIEIIATLKLELFYSKNDIISLYANNAPFSGNIVGINAASWRFFGREPQNLSWAESAFLAILPNSPSQTSLKTQKEILKNKRDMLLEKLNLKGVMSSEELFLAKEESLPTDLKPLPEHAYHLLYRCIQDGHKGENVISTLDYRLQKEVSRRVNLYSEKMAFNKIYNAAAIVLDIKEGKTLAYVGNSNNPGVHGGHVDIITSKRSPGSIFKPFLYAMALDENLILPTQLLPDIPLFYQGFAPKNFDKKYRGAVPADEALSGSLNVPFVYLLREYGYEKFHKRLNDIGLDYLDKPAGHYGLSIILGGAETSLWTVTSIYAGMVRAYNNFWNRNFKTPYSPSDYHPNSYILNNSSTDESQPERSGFLNITSLSYTFQAMQQLRRPEEEIGWKLFGSSRPIAWKTGTSFGFRDGWAIGFNNTYLVGVWVGNADGEGRPGLTGILAASPLMFELFDMLDGDAQFSSKFGVDVFICSKSGMLASAFCSEKLKMELPANAVYSPECSYHQIIHMNSDSSHTVNSSCYEVSKIRNVPWFILPPVQSWYYKKFHPNYGDPPPLLKNCRGLESERTMQLIYPTQMTKVFIPTEQDGRPGKAIFEAAHIHESKKIFWHLDNIYLGVTEHFHQMGIRAQKGKHVLTLVDENGNELTQVIEIIN